MRGRGLKKSAGIFWYSLEQQLLYQARRTEGSPRRVGSHRDTEHPRHRTGLGAGRGPGEPSGGLRARGGDPRGSRSRTQLHPRERDSRDGQDRTGRDGTGRE